MWSTSLCHSTTWSASLSLWRNQRSHMKSLSSWMFWKIPYGVVYFQRFYWCPFYLRYLIGFRHLVLKITARTGPLPGRNRVCLHWKKVSGSVWRHWHHKVRHKHASHVTERMHLGIIQYNRTPPGGILIATLWGLACDLYDLWICIKQGRQWLWNAMDITSINACL